MLHSEDFYRLVFVYEFKIGAGPLFLGLYEHPQVGGKDATVTASKGEGLPNSSAHDCKRLLDFIPLEAQPGSGAQASFVQLARLPPFSPITLLLLHLCNNLDAFIPILFKPLLLALCLSHDVTSRRSIVWLNQFDYFSSDTLSAAYETRHRASASDFQTTRSTEASPEGYK
jgi:hypothetical protein